MVLCRASSRDQIFIHDKWYYMIDPFHLVFFIYILSWYCGKLNNIKSHCHHSIVH